MSSNQTFNATNVQTFAQRLLLVTELLSTIFPFCLPVPELHIVYTCIVAHTCIAHNFVQDFDYFVGRVSRFVVNVKFHSGRSSEYNYSIAYAICSVVAAQLKG